MINLHLTLRHSIVGAIYFLIPLSLIVLGFAIWALLWAINSGQYDDLEGSSWRLIQDDKEDQRKKQRTERSLQE